MPRAKPADSTADISPDTVIDNANAATDQIVIMAKIRRYETAIAEVRQKLAGTVESVAPGHVLLQEEDDIRFLTRLSRTPSLQEVWAPEIQELLDRYQEAAVVASKLGTEKKSARKPKKAKTETVYEMHLRFTPRQRAIIDAIAAKPIGSKLQTTEFSEKLKINSGDVGRVMRYLAAHGLLERTGGEAGPGVFYVVTVKTVKAIKLLPDSDKDAKPKPPQADPKLNPRAPRPRATSDDRRPRAQALAAGHSENPAAIIGQKMLLELGEKGEITIDQEFCARIGTKQGVVTSLMDNAFAREIVVRHPTKEGTYIKGPKFPAKFLPQARTTSTAS